MLFKGSDRASSPSATVLTQVLTQQQVPLLTRGHASYKRISSQAEVLHSKLIPKVKLSTSIQQRDTYTLRTHIKTCCNSGVR